MVTPRGEPTKPKDKIGRCVDLWMVELKLTELGLLEGNQQAIESFRNNMTVDGSPRPDPALCKMIRILEDNQRARTIVAASMATEMKRLAD
jgi:hypothetical protein